MATDFTSTVYDTIASGCISSSEVVVPHLIGAAVPGGLPFTVIDVGAGRGHWAAEFDRHGCDVVAVDGDHVADPVFPIAVHDISRPLPPLGEFQLAVSLEVAEHLPESRAAGFVADLCSLAPVVAFSAAIPHQTGPGHINCQWQSWWAGLFATHGYWPDTTIRSVIWDDDRVEPWYRQNLVIYRHNGPTMGPLDVVHPIIHGWGR